MLRDCAAEDVERAAARADASSGSTGWASSSSCVLDGGPVPHAAPGHDRAAAHRPGGARRAHPLRLPPGVERRRPGARPATIGAGVPRHAQVRPLPPDRRRPGPPAGATWVPTPGRATGTPPTWSGGCAAARRRSRPSCSTSGIWPASATSTPTRSCGGRRCRRCGEAGTLWRRSRSAAWPRRSARRLSEGVRLLGCTLSDFVDTEGQPGGFQDWLQAYGRQGQECRAVRGHHGADGGRGERHGVLPGLPAVDGAGGGAAWLSGAVGHKKGAPSGLAFHLSTALTSFPLHCTPRSFTFAFPLRAPL